MKLPKNCEKCKYYYICRAYYLGPGCKYSEEGRDENIKIHYHRPAHRERPGM